MPETEATQRYSVAFSPRAWEQVVMLEPELETSDWLCERLKHVLQVINDVHQRNPDHQRIHFIHIQRAPHGHPQLNRVTSLRICHETREGEPTMLLITLSAEPAMGYYIR
ncbi:hypothetical protein [Pseudomonas sp. LRF_L74]|uniref:hypothetical protein n=1 Tax=Pseudomonas sp. LRF_L74 TaxID=3369422 RepID=UPI003F6209E7